MIEKYIKQTCQSCGRSIEASKEHYKKFGNFCTTCHYRKLDSPFIKNQLI